MKNLITAFKFIKFAPTKAMLLVSTVMLLVIGVMNMCVNNISLGVICLVMSPYMLIQIPTNICMSGIIGVSAKAKKMNVNVVGAMGTFAAVVSVILVSLVLVLGINVFEVIPAETAGQILVYAGIADLMMGIYMVIGQKYFYISFAVYLVVFFGVFFILGKSGLEFIENIGFTTGIVTYVILTVLSFLSFHVLLRVFYKAPWDPKSVRTGLSG